MSDFMKLNPTAKIFKELKKGNFKWWDAIRNDKKLSVQIRKDNTIDVYYRGGCILGGITIANGIITAKIHPKYIPFSDNKTPRKLILNADGMDFKQGQDMSLLSFGNFEHIKSIKEILDVYYPESSEKSIQYNFATKDANNLDTEFGFSGMKKTRNDLVRADDSIRKIVFIEVKTIADKNLLIDSSDPKSIYSQLKKYYDFVSSNSAALLDYYKKVLQIKNELGINKLSDLKNLDNYSVEEKPLLLFGDCNMEWFNNNAEKLNEKIKNFACAVFYYGNTNSSLDIKQKYSKVKKLFTPY